MPHLFSTIPLKKRGFRAYMQITCDSCHTSYRVNAHLIGETGRKVRCTTCGAVWMTPPADPVDLARDEKNAAHDLPAAMAPDTGEPAPEDLMFIVEGPKPETPPARPEWDVEEDDINSKIDEVLSFRPTAEHVPPQEVEADPEIPESLRTLQAMKSAQLAHPLPQDDEPPVLDARPFGLGAAAFGVAVFLLLSFTSVLGLLVAKGPITRAAPVMAGLYAAMGLQVPAPGEGFSIANMTANLQAEGVLRTLAVSARLSNTSDAALRSPVMRVAVKDADGATLKTWDFAPDQDREIASGETAPVDFSAKDLPANAKTAELTVTSQ